MLCCAVQGVDSRPQAVMPQCYCSATRTSSNIYKRHVCCGALCCVTGGYFQTSGSDASVLLRLKEDYDGAEPAASSVAAMNLIRLAALLPQGGGCSCRKGGDIDPVLVRCFLCLCLCVASGVV
jgi:hypothetical protein